MEHRSNVQKQQAVPEFWKRLSGIVRGTKCSDCNSL